MVGDQPTITRALNLKPSVSKTDPYTCQMAKQFLRTTVYILKTPIKNKKIQPHILKLSVTRSQLHF